jgi:hypothetical protein
MLVLSIVAAFVGLSSASVINARNGVAVPRPTTYAAHTIDMPASRNGISLRSLLTAIQIDHLLDDDRYAPHVNGTFKQRYYFDSTYYKPGGPVYLYIGGETSGPSRFSNLETGSMRIKRQVELLLTLLVIQILMEATNGLGVILENRYYGASYPFSNSTTDNLRYLTTDQSKYLPFPVQVIR